MNLGLWRLSAAPTDSLLDARGGRRRLAPLIMQRSCTLPLPTHSQFLCRGKPVAIADFWSGFDRLCSKLDHLSTAL